MILRRGLILLCALLLVGPAAAHSLRVFARVEGGQVSGYGFFIGGGRPQGVDWQAQMGPETIAKGQTDARGSFGFPAPATATADVVVTVNTGEGHIASTTLKPERFGGAPLPGATVTEPAIMWQAIIHGLFILSAIGIAYTDRLMTLAGQKHGAH